MTLIHGVAVRQWELCVSNYDHLVTTRHLGKNYLNLPRLVFNAFTAVSAGSVRIAAKV